MARNAASSNAFDARVENDAPADDEDTIAARTRTKFSLVDVPIDTLEAFLPDAVEPILDKNGEDREYQRFLSSLLPHEQMDLSFLDEEDEEYEPPEEEDDDEHDEDAAVETAQERMTVKISKKELTELLWDSTRMGVHVPNNTAVTSTLNQTGGLPRTESNGPDTVWNPTPIHPVVYTDGTKDMTAALNFMANATLSHFNGDLVMNMPDSYNPPLPMTVRSTSSRFLRPNDGRPMRHPRILRSTVTQEQCIQLASQMHKHFQLLLQNYHLLLTHNGKEEDSHATVLKECRRMIHELQIRGEKAQRYKSALLSKLNPYAGNNSNTPTDALAQRRVTRSLTAAHAAVAHPSMFELVGSQSLDQLSASFEQRCSIDDRNQAIRDQMQQLDSHLLAAKKKNPKKPFSLSEDNLLAHGVKRWGIDAESWEQIQKNFLPGKSIEILKRRYHYLSSNKTGMNAVKTYHSQYRTQRHSHWLLEEDLRIARGMLEFHDDRKRFARIGLNYLPYRSRLELRKRWERIKAKFRVSHGFQSEPLPNESTIDFVMVLKNHLEEKLRNQMIQKQMKIGEINKQPGDCTESTLPGNAGDDHGMVDLASSKSAKNAQSLTDTTVDTEMCKKTKNLHPALFFTSWSLISPVTLLNKTCEHNWPSLIDKTSSPQSTLIDDEENRSTDRNEQHLGQTQVSEAQPSNVSVSKLRQPLRSNHTSRTSVSEFLFASNPRADSMLKPQMVQFRTREITDILRDGDSTKSYAATVDEDEEDDDDSDYEHDEIFSSDNDDTDSEFEQLELSDGEEDANEAELSAGDGYQQNKTQDTIVNPPTPLSVSRLHQPPRVQHTLRLQNLRSADDERTKRALKALERRIIGKRVQSPSNAASSKASMVNEKQKRYTMTSLMTHPTVPGSHLKESNTSNTIAKTGKDNDGENDDDDGDDASWSNASDDDSFECEELIESSDESIESESYEVDSYDDENSRDEVDERVAMLPKKKIRTHPSRCDVCSGAPCVCSSVRMQQLLHRMNNTDTR